MAASKSYCLSPHRLEIIRARTKMAYEVHSLSVKDLRKRIEPDSPVWLPLLQAIEAEQTLAVALQDLQAVDANDPEDGMSKRFTAEMREAFAPGAPVA